MTRNQDVEKRQLNIEIGAQIFHVFFMKPDYRLLNGIKRGWCEYLTDCSEGGCRVEISSYNQARPFFWNEIELERFRRYFKVIHGRFPADENIDRTVDESIRLLQHLDPEEERLRLIRSLIDRPESLVYARVDQDLFFFDTALNVVFFFIQKKALLFAILFRIMNGMSFKQSALMLGFINGMMFALSYLLIRNKGILLHGSALQRGGRTVLFIGLSGAGKSTVTRLCRPDICFSDDGAVIRKEGDHVYAYNSPFTQDLKRHKNPLVIKGEIEKIFLLEKGYDHVVLPIDKNEVMHVVLMHLIHFYRYLNEETARQGFYILKEILDILPVYKLEFAREGEIWNNIF